jgi:NADPH2:quinone reductase
VDVYFGRHPQEARQAPTAGADSAGRVATMGASTVLDYHEPDWPEGVRVLTGGGADAAANAVRAGSVGALRALRDGGRLATITADLPAAERDITMRAVQVAADGRRLGRLVQLFAQGLLAVSVDDRFPLEQAGAALAGARHGAHGSATALRTGAPG